MNIYSALILVSFLYSYSFQGKGSMYTYWLTGRDDFDMLGLDSSARGHMGIQEHRYAHMYDQMYKGRVQFAGKNLCESPINL